jgi:hypothetical protein
MELEVFKPMTLNPTTIIHYQLMANTIVFYPKTSSNG